MNEYNEQAVETLDDAGCIIANKNIRKVSALNATLVQLLIAMVVIVVYLAVRGQIPFTVPGGSQLVYVLVLGVVNTGLACYLYFSSMFPLIYHIFQSSFSHSFLVLSS